MIPEMFSLHKGLLNLLLNKQVDLIQVLEEGLIEAIPNPAHWLVYLFEEPVESETTGEYPILPEVLRPDREERGVGILDLEDGIDLKEDVLDYLVVGEFFLDVEEVEHQGQDLVDRVGDCRVTLGGLGLLWLWWFHLVKVLAYWDHCVGLVGWAQDLEGFVVILYVPI